MKYIAIILLTAFTLVNCKNKKKVTEGNVTPTEVKYSATDMVASIERTMCFGVCPAYKMEIYGNGKVVYEGVRHVDNIGKYTGETTTDKIDLLLAKAKEIGYMELNDSYENKLVTDLPSTTTVILLNGVSKRIYTRYDTPEKLKTFQKYFESLFKDIELSKQE